MHKLMGRSYKTGKCLYNILMCVPSVLRITFFRSVLNCRFGHGPIGNPRVSIPVVPVLNFDYNKTPG